MDIGEQLPHRAMLLRCDCGHEVHADDEGSLVEAAQAHARDVHQITFSYEQILLAVLREELDSSAAWAGDSEEQT